MIILIVFSLMSSTLCASVTESYKDQFCTDPRTMRQHAAYTEWADAYSCTRHRCQPGGRNLAIYTVGCKRVEAPESAIECEEVVEDTNMQFPYCCTRLRCLVVVRGEVWTRVLGQPWEALPAAPWSHMYKMKRPPPSAGTFLPNTPEAGPIYELADSEKQKVMRASKTPDPDCEAPAAPAPDIVIALSTSTDEKDDHKKTEGGRRQMPSYRRQYRTTSSPYAYEAEHEADTALGLDDSKPTTEKAPLTNQRAETEMSDEKMFPNSFDTPTEKTAGPESWTEIPQSQWNEPDPGVDAEVKDSTLIQDPTKETPASNLQALVDAIGTRMRDIETVVQRMSDKVHDEPVLGSEEKRLAEGDATNHKQKTEPKEQQAKQPAADSEYYKRFTVRSHGSKYLHTSEATTEAPLFVEDTNTNTGYFSDASNSVLRRPKLPKEPAETYMAPVDTRRKHESSDDTEKKHKKHTHKKKNKHGHKKRHGKDEKKRKHTKISSVEIDRNMVSLEDNSAPMYQD